VTASAALDVNLLLETPAALAARPLKIPVPGIPFFYSKGNINLKKSDSGTPDFKKVHGGTAFRPPVTSSLFLFMRSLLTTLRSLSNGYMLRVSDLAHLIEIAWLFMCHTKRRFLPAQALAAAQRW
jgi:hypothetical protein